MACSLYLPFRQAVNNPAFSACCGNNKKPNCFDTPMNNWISRLSATASYDSPYRRATSCQAHSTPPGNWHEFPGRRRCSPHPTRISRHASSHPLFRAESRICRAYPPGIGKRTAEQQIAGRVQATSPNTCRRKEASRRSGSSPSAMMTSCECCPSSGQSARCCGG